MQFIADMTTEDFLGYSLILLFLSGFVFIALLTNAVIHWHKSIEPERGQPGYRYRVALGFVAKATSSCVSYIATACRSFMSYCSELDKAITSRIESMRPETIPPFSLIEEAPDFSYWGCDPSHRIATTHRVMQVGRSKARLIISDYPDGKSTGKVVKGSTRINLNENLISGPSADETLMETAVKALA